MYILIDGDMGNGQVMTIHPKLLMSDYLSKLIDKNTKNTVGKNKNS